MKNAINSLKETINTTSDSVVIGASNKTVAITTSTGIIGSMANWNWVSIISILIGLITMVVSIFFNFKRYKREQEEHKYKILEYKASIEQIESHKGNTYECK